MCSSCILWRLNHTHLRDKRRENFKKKEKLDDNLDKQWVCIVAELKGYGSMTALGFFFVILNDFFSCHKF